MVGGQRAGGGIASIRKAIAPSPLKMDIIKFNGHPLQRYTIGNSVSYFLRLPDGYNGSGTTAYNNESLTQLRDSQKSITAVDKSTSYTSWSDFTNTLKAIMDYEKGLVGQSNPWVNVADFDSSLNPNDHADHKATSDAVASFAHGTYTRGLYVTYDSQNRAPILSDPSLTNKKIYTMRMLMKFTVKQLPMVIQ